MTGSPVEKVVLQLNTHAKSLLVEEYPLAERDLKREDGTWLLRPTFRPTFFLTRKTLFFPSKSRIEKRH